MLAVVPLHARPSFEQLLVESGLALNPPAGFSLVERTPADAFPHERVLRHESGMLEIRYAIRPLARLRVDYNDPHSSAPEPEHMFEMLFTTITERLAAGRHSPRRTYSPAEAKKLFNADWAAASVFDVDAALSTEYQVALLLAMHKGGKADAYVMFLYRDPERAKPIIREARSALSFVR
jgi:hypothetical protein